jgi:hypothetical protein
VSALVGDILLVILRDKQLAKLARFFRMSFINPGAFLP